MIRIISAPILDCVRPDIRRAMIGLELKEVSMNYVHRLPNVQKEDDEEIIMKSDIIHRLIKSGEICAADYFSDLSEPFFKIKKDCCMLVEPKPWKPLRISFSSS